MNKNINIDNLCFYFNEKEQVLDDISLSLKKGSFLSILGASGSGKSTLLRILSNILPANKKDKITGTVTIFGNSTREYLNTGRLSFMFQEASLMPNLTVRQNISFPLKLRGKIIDEALVNELLEIVGLTKDEEKYPSQLSGGMKTRVSLARAFVTKPELLLLDEPFSALDVSWRYELYNYMQIFKNKFNTTVLLVTHDIQESVVLADELVILSQKGNILDKITPEQKDVRDYTFAGINDRIESNLSIILDVQTKIMIDGIRENRSYEEAYQVVTNLIEKDRNDIRLTDYEIKEVHAVKNYIEDPELFSMLQKLWNNSDNWKIKNEIMWRILDNPKVSIEFHEQVHSFILGDWENYSARMKKEQYFQVDKIIQNTIERLSNTNYPSTKDWLYLTYLKAMCTGNENLENKALEFIKKYISTNSDRQFSKFINPLLDLNLTTIEK